MKSKKTAIKALLYCLAIAVAAIVVLMAAVFFLRGGPASQSLLIADLDMDLLLSQGKPLVLNFGDQSQDSLDTLAALEEVNETLSGLVLIRAVDVSENPAAREGFPVQIMPTQFFYTADGKPINLPGNLGVVISTFISQETGEPVFSAHEGPLTSEELLKVLEYMGVVQLQYADQ